jgi:hypothetical protein
MGAGGAGINDVEMRDANAASAMNNSAAGSPGNPGGNLGGNAAPKAVSKASGHIRGIRQDIQPREGSGSKAGERGLLPPPASGTLFGANAEKFGGQDGNPPQVRHEGGRPSGGYAGPPGKEKM